MTAIRHPGVVCDGTTPEPPETRYVVLEESPLLMDYVELEEGGGRVLLDEAP